MMFRELKLSGNNQGAAVNYCLIHDGSNLTTTNTNGVRDVNYYSVYIDGWTSEGAQFNNATHARIFGMTCSPAGGSAIAVRISGNSTAANAKTSDMEVYGLQAYGGAVILDNCHQCVVVGRATDLAITSGCTNSIIQVTTDNQITFPGTTRDALRRTNHTVVFDGQDDALYVNNGKVVGPRINGRSVPTGSSFAGDWDTGTITLGALAQVVKQIDADLRTHGLRGA
jgi:hypothetical protein